MGTRSPEPISHEDGPSPEPDGGHRRLLPWGSAPFGGIGAGDRNRSVASAAPSCPQGFSPSRRFTPTRTSWLCFTPHPPLGFWSSELFPLRQPRYLSISVALLSFRQPPGFTGEPVSPCGPRSPSSASPSMMGSSPEIPPRTSDLRQTSSTPIIRLTPNSRWWRVARATQRVVARLSLGSRLTPLGKLQRLRASQGVDFRAFIRRRVRSRYGMLPLYQVDALLTSSPPRYISSIVGLAPSPLPLSTKVSFTFRRRLPSSGGPGYRSDRAWKKLQRVPSTPYGFFTSLPQPIRFRPR
jgi:hypothetical protein